MRFSGQGPSFGLLLLPLLLLIRPSHAVNWPEPGGEGPWDVVLVNGTDSITLAGGATEGDPPLRVLAPDNLTYPAFLITGDGGLDLSAVYLEDHSNLRLQQGQGIEFQQAVALGWLGNATNVALRNVRVNTSCTTVRDLQELACNQLSDQQVGRLQIEPGRLYVPAWDGPALLLRDVEYLCEPAAEGYASAAMLPMLNCSVAHVTTWDQLVERSRTLQLSALRVHIMLDTNMSVPFNYSAVVGDGEGERDPSRAIQVYRRMRVASSPIVEGALVYMSLGYIQGEGLWRMVRPTGQLLFENLTFLTLPLGPINKYPMSVLPWGMWNVEMDRCDPIYGMLILKRCKLITQSEIMDYISYWAGESLSVFPDRAEAAQWYGQDPTCNPVQNRSLLSQQITLRDQGTWDAANVTVLGVTLLNTILTSKLPAGLRHTQPGLQLTKLFPDPYTPFPDITWVATPRQLVRALSSQSTPNIVLLTNVSVAASLWPKEGVTLTRDMAVSGWPSRPTVLDWQGVAGVVNVGRFSLRLRNMVLLNGGQGSATASPNWASNLTLYQWPIIHPWGSTSLQLEAVTVIVPPSEFQILRRNSRAAGGNPVVPQLAELTWLQTTTSWSQDSCAVPMIVEDGFLGFNMTISDEAVAFAALPQNVQLASEVDANGPNGANGSSSADALPWKLVLAVVLPVVMGTLVVLAGCLFAWSHRRAGSNPCDSLQQQVGRWPGAKLRFGAPPKMDHDLDGPGPDSGGAGGSPGSAYPPGAPPAGGALLTGRAAPKSAEYGSHGSDQRLNMRMPSDIESQGWPSGSLPGGKGSSVGRGNHELAHTQSRLSTVADASVSPKHSRTHSIGGSSHPGAGMGRGSRTPGGGLTPRAGGATGGNSNASLAAHNTPRTPGHAVAVAGAHTGTHGRSVGGVGCARSSGSTTGTSLDSFDMAPQDLDELLINRMNMSRDLREAAAAPDVAAQLKAMVARMQDELGDQEVIVMRVIGHGGAGVVYQGSWRGLTVAVKTLVFSVLPAQPMTRRQQRAFTEAAICRTLQHPNIVATYAHEIQALTSARPQAHPGSQEHVNSGAVASTLSHNSGQDQGQGLQFPGLPPVCAAAEYKLYIIQEYCDGGTLRSLIDEGKLHVFSKEAEQPPNPLMGHIIQLAADIAAGMAHVHSRNIVHGDLTPSNVLLRISPQTVSRYIAKVADFGLSWKLASGQEHVSNAAQGTAFYIAPEVLHVGIMSKAADVFSFGMLLHEMFHGTPVWRKGRTTLVEAAAVATKRPGLDQLQWAPACPDWLRMLITACVAPDPKARPCFKDVAMQLASMAQARAQAGADAISALTFPMAPMESCGASVANSSAGSLGGGASIPGRAVLAPSPPAPPPLSVVATQLLPPLLQPVLGSPTLHSASRGLLDNMPGWQNGYGRMDSCRSDALSVYQPFPLAGLLGVPGTGAASQPVTSNGVSPQANTSLSPLASPISAPLAQASHPCEPVQLDPGSQAQGSQGGGRVELATISDVSLQGPGHGSDTVRGLLEASELSFLHLSPPPILQLPGGGAAAPPCAGGGSQGSEDGAAGSARTGQAAPLDGTETTLRRACSSPSGRTGRMAAGTASPLSPAPQRSSGGQPDLPSLLTPSAVESGGSSRRGSSSAGEGVASGPGTSSAGQGGSPAGGHGLTLATGCARPSGSNKSLPLLPGDEGPARTQGWLQGTLQGSGVQSSTPPSPSDVRIALVGSEPDVAVQTATDSPRGLRPDSGDGEP